MNKKKMILTLAILLVIVGFIGMAASFSSYSKSANAEKSETIPLEMEAINELQIDTGNTSIYFRPVDEKGPRVEYYAKGRTVNYEKMTSSVEGETQVIKTRQNFFNFFDLDFLFQSKSTFHIYLPDNELEKITAETVNGVIEANDMEIPSLVASTTNGRITLESIIGNVDAQATNGRINLENIAGETEAKATNGRINVVTEGFDFPMELETVNGKIVIQSNQEPTNATLDLRTVNGSINVFGSKDWDVSYGNGENKIKARTTNGGITIE